MIEQWLLTFLLIWLSSIILSINQEEDGWFSVFTTLLKLIGFVGTVVTTFVWIWI